MNEIKDLLERASYQRAVAAWQPACAHCGDVGYTLVPVQHGRFVYMDEQPCPYCRPDTCATCGGKGEITYAVPVDDPRFGKLFPCPDCDGGRKLERAAVERSLKNAKLPPGYEGLTFATWDALPDTEKQGKMMARIAVGSWATAAGHTFTMGDVYDAARVRYQGEDRQRNSLVLSGPVGTSKTGLAAAAVNYMASQRQQALYTRTADLFTSLHAAYERSKRDEPGESAEEILDRYKRAPVLVLDEFSTYHKTDWRMAQAEELIRFRHGEALPTLVTTNADQDTLEAEWGLRTASALLGMAHWIDVAGASIRKHAQPQGSW